MVYHSIRMIEIHCAYSLHGHGNETISQQANNCRLWMWRSQTGTTKSCNGLIWAITSPENTAFMLLNLFGDAIHPTDIIRPQKECLYCQQKLGIIVLELCPQSKRGSQISILILGIHSQTEATALNYELKVNIVEACEIIPLEPTLVHHLKVYCYWCG